MFKQSGRRAASPDCGATFFTTVDLPESERFSQWMRTVCHDFIDLKCLSNSPASFFGEIKATQVKQVCFTHLRTRQISYERTPAGIRRGKEKTLVINFQVSGTSSISQDGRKADLIAGDFACFDTSRPYFVSASDANEVVSINIPANIFTNKMGHTEQVTALAVRGKTQIGALVSNMFRHVVTHIDSVRSTTAERLATTSIDLVIAALSDMLEQQPLHSGSGRTLLLYRAKTMIDDHLSDPSLTIERIARDLGISRRYLTELFQAEGTSVCKWMWQRRLEKARAALSSHHLAGQSISVIAFDCGFSDMSHFCHRFRQAFSVTPTEFRRAHAWNMLQ